MSWFDRLLRRKPPSPPRGQDIAAERTNWLHDVRADARAGQISHPNTAYRTPVLPRRPAYTAETLAQQTVTFVDALFAAGSLDDQSYPVCDAWLGAILRQQWDSIARKFHQDLHEIAARRSQVFANLRETELALAQIALGLRIVDHSMWLSRNALLTEQGGTRAWEVERQPDAFATAPIFAPGTRTLHPDEAPRLGVDYAFLVDHDRAPVWRLRAPLQIVLVGPCPAGADAVLRQTVEAIQPWCQLPLEIGPPQPAHRADDEPLDGQIAVGYSDDATVEDGHLGRGSATVRGREHVHGQVLLRTAPHNDPSAPQAKSVMLHEMLHALGIGHCQEGLDEVMTPAQGGRTSLGRGDQAATRAIRVAWETAVPS